MHRHPLIPDSMVHLFCFLFLVVWTVFYIPGWLLRKLKDPNAV
jgi:hypothetical protein